MVIEKIWRFNKSTFHLRSHSPRSLVVLAAGPFFFPPWSHEIPDPQTKVQRLVDVSWCFTFKSHRFYGLDMIESPVSLDTHLWIPSKSPTKTTEIQEHSLPSPTSSTVKFRKKIPPWELPMRGHHRISKLLVQGSGPQIQWMPKMADSQRPGWTNSCIFHVVFWTNLG